MLFRDHQQLLAELPPDVTAAGHGRARRRQFGA